MLYWNVFNSVNGNVCHIGQLQLLKSFPYIFAMFRYSFPHVIGMGLRKRLEHVYKTLQKRVHVGLLLSLLHVLLTKFEGCGRFQNVTLLEWRPITSWTRFTRERHLHVQVTSNGLLGLVQIRNNLTELFLKMPSTQLAQMVPLQWAKGSPEL